MKFQKNIEKLEKIENKLLILVTWAHCGKGVNSILGWKRNMVIRPIRTVHFEHIKRSESVCFAEVRSYCVLGP